jgi:hypothetical protein
MLHTFSPKNRDVYEIMWKNIEETKKQLMTHTHTHTHTEYQILLTFARLLWLCKRASMASYRYIACLVEAVVAIKTEDSASFASIKKDHS